MGKYLAKRRNIKKMKLNWSLLTHGRREYKKHFLFEVDYYFIRILMGL